MILVHFNYIVGMEQKVYLQKELLFWNYDKNGYYTSTSNKYLTILYKSRNKDEEEFYLKIGLELSLQLNRKFILPQLSCKYCSSMHKSGCHFAIYFSVREINKNYGEENYRENVYNYIFIVFSTSSISS